MIKPLYYATIMLSVNIMLKIIPGLLQYIGLHS